MKKNKRTSWARMPFAEIAVKIAEYFGLRLLTGLILAVSALIFFAWLADEIFEGDVKIFDETVRQAANQIASPVITHLMKFLSFAGSAFVLAPLGIVIVVIFLRLKWRRATVLFAVAMIGEVILSLTLKGVFRRTRPEAFFGYELPSSYSFPSGHALGAFCFFGILAWLITARLKNRTAKILIWTLAVTLIFSIGFSRIYLGVHFPSDVVGGYSAALVWTVTVALGDFFFARRRLRKA
ncbi:MAG: phosphatase PAP2 family protein [Pyrinomonadaceae bacterium]